MSSLNHIEKNLMQHIDEYTVYDSSSDSFHEDSDNNSVNVDTRQLGDAILEEKLEDITAIVKGVAQNKLKWCSIHDYKHEALYNPIVFALVNNKFHAIKTLLNARVVDMSDYVIKELEKEKTNANTPSFGLLLTYFQTHKSLPSFNNPLYTSLSRVFYETLGAAFDFSDIVQGQMKEMNTYDYNDRENAMLGNEDEVFLCKKYKVLKNHYTKPLKALVAAYKRNNPASSSDTEIDIMFKIIVARIVSTLDGLAGQGEGKKAELIQKNRQKYLQKGMNSKAQLIAICHTALRALLGGELSNDYRAEYDQVNLREMLVYYYLAAIETDKNLLPNADPNKSLQQHVKDGLLIFFSCLASMQRKFPEISGDTPSCNEGIFSRLTTAAAPNNILASTENNEKLPEFDDKGITSATIRFIVTELREQLQTPEEAIAIGKFYDLASRANYLDVEEEKSYAQLKMTVISVLQRINTNIGNNSLDEKITTLANDTLHAWLGRKKSALSKNKLNPLRNRIENDLKKLIQEQAQKFLDHANQVNPMMFINDSDYNGLPLRIQNNALRKAMILLFDEIVSKQEDINRFYQILVTWHQQQNDITPFLVSLCDRKPNRQIIFRALIEKAKNDNPTLFIQLISDNVDLSNMDLSRKNLSTANLSQTNLKNVTIDKDTCFESTKLERKQIKQLITSAETCQATANLSKVDLSNKDLSTLDLTPLNLSNANLGETNLHDATFSLQALTSTAFLKDLQVDKATLKKNNFSSHDIKTLKQKIANNCRHWIKTQIDKPRQNRYEKFNNTLEYLNKIQTDQQHVLKIACDTPCSSYREVLRYGREALIKLIKNDSRFELDSTSINTKMMQSVFMQDNSNNRHNILELQRAVFRNNHYWLNNVTNSDSNIETKFKQITHYLHRIQNDPYHVLNINFDVFWRTNKTTDYYKKFLTFAQQQLHKLANDQNFLFKDADDTDAVKDVFLNQNILSWKEREQLKIRMVKHRLQILRSIRDDKQLTPSEKIIKLLDFLKPIRGNKRDGLKISRYTLWSYGDTDAYALVINYGRKMITELLVQDSIAQNSPQYINLEEQQRNALSSLFRENIYSVTAKTLFFGSLDNVDEVLSLIKWRRGSEDSPPRILYQGPEYKFFFKSIYHECLPDVPDEVQESKKHNYQQQTKEQLSC